MRRQRKTLLVALLLLALAVPLAATPPPGDGRAAVIAGVREAGGSFLDYLRGILGRLLPAFPKAGANMDPNGGATQLPLAAPPQPGATAQSDAGANMDPDGISH